MKLFTPLTFSVFFTQLSHLGRTRKSIYLVIIKQTIQDKLKFISLIIYNCSWKHKRLCNIINTSEVTVMAVNQWLLVVAFITAMIFTKSLSRPKRWKRSVEFQKLEAEMIKRSMELQSVLQNPIVR